MKFWKGKTVLLTGHTGFKGSWLSLWLQSLGVNLIGYSLAPVAFPNLFEITQLHQGMINIISDIRNYESLYAVVQKYQPEIIIHMAAQSLVRESYQAPLETYSTNIMGTINLLEVARWIDSVKVVVNVTSDKCYENTGLNNKFCEKDRLGGYDPYSNSKACSELITQTYRDVFFKEREVGVASARAGNVIGGGDWAKDRLVPDVLTACIKQENILLRYPDAVRPWQHVLQPLYGYLNLAERLYFSPQDYSESWNFGPDSEDIKSVSWVTDYLIKISNSSIKWIKDKNKHLHEASTLQLDCSKAKERLDWVSIWNLETGLQKTSEWFYAYQEGLPMLDKTISQINQFASECGPIQKEICKEILND
ncbi:MAG: CDP-glucose 4,6-dehydratase [Gammaproteobacteria bacterium]|nr:MAG: CDP-glucose 4,6-dehydratase [Gammaproteobacteria bacterium]